MSLTEAELLALVRMLMMFGTYSSLTQITDLQPSANNRQLSHYLSSVPLGGSAAAVDTSFCKGIPNNEPILSTKRKIHCSDMILNTLTNMILTASILLISRAACLSYLARLK